MNDQPTITSVPSIPMASPPDGAGAWTVPGAIGTAVIVFGGSQVLGFLCLQIYIAWAEGLGRAIDLGAPEKLPAFTRQMLVVVLQLVVTALQLVTVWWLSGSGGRDRAAALQLGWVRLGFGGWIAAIGLVLGIKILATMATAWFGKVANPREEMAPFIELARDNRLWLGFVVAGSWRH